MNLTALLAEISYQVVQGQDREITAITYDSRQAGAGSLFVCLPGAFADGHDYAKGAYNRGCRAFLCQRMVDLPEDAFQAVTADTRSALATISATFYGHPAGKLKIIGITGTKGKTTTALLIHSILEKNHIPCGYIGSNGVLMAGELTPTVNTTPESLALQGYFSAMVAAGITHAVIEVSSQALEHNRVQGLEFDTVVFTNLSPDHIGKGEHESFEAYRAAKRKLFTDYGCQLIVYNADDEASGFMLQDVNAPKLAFSTQNAEAEFYGSRLGLFREDTSLGICFDCTHGGKTDPVSVRTPGAFSVYNALGAIAVCSRYGVSVEAAAEALGKTSVTGRFEVVDGIPGRTFIVDYAHNGLSLTSALQVLRQYQPERLICLFGSVGGRTQGRRQELAEAASQYADYCIITSDNPDWEAPEEIIRQILCHYDPATPYTLEPDREKAVRLAVNMARFGDIVLFAGKGHETYQLIQGVKHPFSERRIIEEVCAAWGGFENHQREETICI